MHHIYSYSYALEDVFFLYLNAFERGFFVDIGCGHPTSGSNSKLLESWGWTGVCIDIAKNDEWDEESRITKCLTVDATSADYRSILKTAHAPSLIDAISIDIDDGCYDALRMIPFDEWRFKSIIIEHDLYRTNALRDPEREFLAALGYGLVCADVAHEPGRPFEDWWLNAACFDPALIDRLRCNESLDIDIIRRFGHQNTIIRLNGFHGTYPQTEIA